MTGFINKPNLGPDAVEGADLRSQAIEKYIRGRRNDSLSVGYVNLTYCAKVLRPSLLINDTAYLKISISYAPLDFQVVFDYRTGSKMLYRCLKYDDINEDSSTSTNNNSDDGNLLYQAYDLNDQEDVLPEKKIGKRNRNNVKDDDYLSPSYMADLLKNEINLHLQLDLPNITQIIKVFENNDESSSKSSSVGYDEVHLLYQYNCENKDLFQYMNEYGPCYCYDIICKVAIDILIILVNLHESGIILSDLHPRNFLITQRNNSTVSVNLVRMPFAIKTDVFLTASSGVAAYSSSYFSPEMMNGNVITESHDIFCFGSLMFSFITGTTLFTGDLQTIYDNLISNSTDQMYYKGGKFFRNPDNVNSEQYQFLQEKSSNSSISSSVGILPIANILVEILGTCLRDIPSERPSAHHLLIEFQDLMDNCGYWKDCTIDSRLNNVGFYNNNNSINDYNDEDYKNDSINLSNTTQLSYFFKDFVSTEETLQESLPAVQKTINEKDHHTDEKSYEDDKIVLSKLKISPYTSDMIADMLEQNVATTLIAGNWLKKFLRFRLYAWTSSCHLRRALLLLMAMTINENQHFIASALYSLMYRSLYLEGMAQKTMSGFITYSTLALFVGMSFENQQSNNAERQSMMHYKQQLDRQPNTKTNINIGDNSSRYSDFTGAGYNNNQLHFLRENIITFSTFKAMILGTAFAPMNPMDVIDVLKNARVSNDGVVSDAGMKFLKNLIAGYDYDWKALYKETEARGYSETMTYGSQEYIHISVLRDLIMAPQNAYDKSMSIFTNDH